MIKIWTRLIHGLRIRQRLQAQYANKPEEERHWLDTQSHALLESGKDKDKVHRTVLMRGTPHET